MELKYYLRGLGLGIAITAVIMGLASSKNKTMTNDEIIARARQLGMTEEDTVLSEIKQEDETEDTDAGNTEAGMDAVNTDKGNAETDADAVNTDKSNAETDADAVNADKSNAETDADAVNTDKTDTKTDVNAVNTDNSDTKTDTETGADAVNTDKDNVETVSKKDMVITIGSGDGSYSASRKLADVGAVESADEFDDYLCNNGYDKKIRAGTYTIPENASNEQMAKIITGAQ